jgi:hypothetical protein
MLLPFLLLMELGNKLKKKIAMIMLRGVIDTKHIPSVLHYMEFTFYLKWGVLSWWVYDHLLKSF